MFSLDLRLATISRRAGLTAAGAILLWGTLALSVSAQTGAASGDQAGTAPAPQTTDKPAAPAKASKKKPAAKPAPPAKAPVSAKTDSKMAMMNRRVVLVFLPDAKEGAGDTLGDIVTGVEQSRLAASGLYRTVYFLPSLSTVKRALTEQTLSAQDVKAPYDITKVKRLAQLTGYSLAVVTSVDDYQYDADKKQVSLIMSAQLIDTSGETPKIVSAGESAKSPDKTPAGATEASLAEQTARDLTETLMTVLLKPPSKTPRPATAPPVAAPEKKDAGDAKP